jgi:hypothetical protein
VSHQGGAHHMIGRMARGAPTVMWRLGKGRTSSMRGPHKSLGGKSKFKGVFMKFGLGGSNFPLGQG